jgi:hypothetical protein
VIILRVTEDTFECLILATGICQAIDETLSYAEGIISLKKTPLEIVLDIHENLDQLRTILAKYRAILKNTKFDAEHKADIRNASKTFDSDSVIVYSFLTQLDVYLMDYGDGPEFRKPYIFTDETPLEV